MEIQSYFLYNPTIENQKRCNQLTATEKNKHKTISVTKGYLYWNNSNGEAVYLIKLSKINDK